MKLQVKTLDNGEAGEIELDDGIFGIEAPRSDLLHRMVNWQLAKRRAGTHAAKTVSQVNGSGKKPFKQKGTGRARQGTRKAPQLRGGAVAAGPLPRDHSHDLTKKVRRLALRHALSAKAGAGKLMVIEALAADSHKTGALRPKLEALGLSSALIIEAGDIDANFALASRNLPLIDTLPTDGANVYDILRRDVLVLTKGAAERLEERLK